jgi:hypothetical protein
MPLFNASTLVTVAVGQPSAAAVGDAEDVAAGAADADADADGVGVGIGVGVGLAFPSASFVAVASRFVAFGSAVFASFLFFDADLPALSTEAGADADDEGTGEAPAG